MQISKIRKIAKANLDKIIKVRNGETATITCVASEYADRYNGRKHIEIVWQVIVHYPHGDRKAFGCSNAQRFADNISNDTPIEVL